MWNALMENISQIGCKLMVAVIHCRTPKKVVQWGFEIGPFENRNHSKTGLFED